MSEEITRIERGWPGHFICAYKCGFRRNTLLICDDKRVVVSTVGDMRESHEEAQEIGCERYYETMAFYARDEGEFIEADIQRHFDFDSDCAISEPYKDNMANEMHEKVVEEITFALRDSAINKEKKE